ncbi:MAG: hypothetical protein IJ629_05035 [Clostridia bacterium]|nr:hypothetical protein [Clostridia bacterium]
MHQLCGTGPEYIYEDLETISEVSSQSTVESIEGNQMIEKRIDWTPLYGSLEERKLSNKTI